MTTAFWIVLVAVAFLIGAAAAALLLVRRRRAHLRARFGPEYAHVLHNHGNTREAEKELRQREERVEHMHIHPLPATERKRFAESWRGVQSHFVDEPARTVDEADELVETVMELRGYPVGDFEQRSADVSVDHPNVVANYRAAHAIAARSQVGEATTEDLRQAMVHYRALFEDLLEEPSVDDRYPREANDARNRTTARYPDRQPDAWDRHPGR